MSAYTKVSPEEMEAIWSGGFQKARGALGVRAFGININSLPPNFDRVLQHNHTFDDQEEILIPLNGSGFLLVDDERIPLGPETIARIGPGVNRALAGGPDGISALIVGAPVEGPYVPFKPLDVGEPEPNTPDLPGIKAAQGHESDGDITVMDLSEIEPFTGYYEGVTMFPVRRSLGIEAVGINIIDIQPAPGEANGSGHPIHDHVENHHEEVYVVIDGGGEVLAGEEKVPVAKGEMIRLAPDTPRQLIPAEGGIRVIAISNGLPD
jgi:uncharacterized cupin superfamily protein